MGEIRSYLKGLQTIEKLHRLQTDLYTSLVGNLEILYRDLTESDFISILTLFKTKECQFINEVNSCITLSNFIVEDFKVHGTYFHTSPQMQNFTYFSCAVIEINQVFYINSLHNQFLLPKDIQNLNHTRKVQASDFVLNDLKVVVKRDIFDKSECFNLFFLQKLDFL